MPTSEADVVVWDDVVYLYDHVVATLARLLPCPKDRATRMATELHENGRVTVTTLPVHPAEQLALRLRAETLTTTVEV